MQNIVVVDDHKVFAELLAMALTREPDLLCVGHAQTVEEGMALVESLRPDIVIMDVQLGDGDGIAATAELSERFPDLRVVVLTAHVDQRLLRQALDCMPGVRAPARDAALSEVAIKALAGAA